MINRRLIVGYPRLVTIKKINRPAALVWWKSGRPGQFGYVCWYQEIKPGLRHQMAVIAGRCFSENGASFIGDNKPSSSLSHFYVGSIWDDSRLHAARSNTSPDSPFSLRSSFTQSAHLFFGHPLLLPCTSVPITLFPTYSSSLLITCPYHCILHSWTFFEITPTFVLPLILSNLVTPHVHCNIL